VSAAVRNSRRTGSATTAAQPFVGAAELVVGDVALIGAAHRVRADSTQTSGRLSVDEPMLMVHSGERVWT
jgi:hypothetical protein